MPITRSKRTGDSPPADLAPKKPRTVEDGAVAPDADTTEAPAAAQTTEAPVAAEATEVPAATATAEAPAATATEPLCAKHLLKSEPELRLQDGYQMKFSIDDLLTEADGVVHWEGVRNTDARDCLLTFKKGDLAFFFHDNCTKLTPGIVGIVEVVREAYPDPTALNPKDALYDPMHSEESPRWYMVDVRLVRRFTGVVSMEALEATPELADMEVVRRGRVSVQDVTQKEWNKVLEMAAAFES